MSLGATMSAPARAWETAVGRAARASSRCRPSRPGRSTPQWPWLVYSHRHRSVITMRSGSASLIARVASWTTPSSSHAPEPSSSLAAGRPNRSTAGMPLRPHQPPRRRRGRSTDGPPPASPGSVRAGRSRGPRTSEGQSRPDPGAFRGPARAARWWRAVAGGGFGGTPWLKREYRRGRRRRQRAVDRASSESGATATKRRSSARSAGRSPALPRRTDRTRRTARCQPDQCRGKRSRRRAEDHRARRP